MINQIETAYFNYLSVEKGLSKNTLNAYRRDLNRFFHYLDLLKKDLKSIKSGDLPLYLAWLRGLNNEEFAMGESSIARNVVALRNFFDFLAEEHNFVDITSNFHPVGSCCRADTE